jgi:hypothetical protein
MLNKERLMIITEFSMKEYTYLLMKDLSQQ